MPVIHTHLLGALPEPAVVAHQAGDELHRHRLVDRLPDAARVQLVSPALLGAVLARERDLGAVLVRLPARVWEGMSPGSRAGASAGPRVGGDVSWEPRVGGEVRSGPE